MASNRASTSELTSNMDTVEEEEEYSYAAPEIEPKYTSNMNEATNAFGDYGDIYDDVQHFRAGSGTMPRPRPQPSTPVVLNIDNRDPNNVNGFVKVSWDDVFAEPENIHSDECVWNNAIKCFKGSKLWCYRVCTFVFGLPLACCWGITFAMISFCHIWYVVPSLKAFMIELTCVKKIWAVLIYTFCDPCYESFALVFSRIAIRFQGETSTQNGYDHALPTLRQ